MKHPIWQWPYRQRRAAAMALSLVVPAAACQPAVANAPDAEASVVSSDESQEPPAAVPSPEALAEQAARPSARDWLALIDGGRYGESWEAAANVFKMSVSKEKWQEAVQGARAPLGALSSRQFRAAKYENELPNAPEGKYVVVHYDSVFAERSSAREIVTLRQAADESWKVAGYFVK